MRPSARRRQRGGEVRTWGDGLGDDGVPALRAPRDEDLRGRRVVLLCDLERLGVLGEPLVSRHCRFLSEQTPKS